MSRDVIFRLKVERDPGLREELRGFAAEAARAQQEAKRQVSGTAAGTDQAFRAEAQQRLQQETEVLKGIQSERDDIRQLEARVQADHQENQLRKLEKHAEDKLKVETDLAERIATIRAETNENDEKSVLKSQRAIRDAQTRANQRLDAIHKRMETEKLRQTQAGTKARLAVLKAEEREHERTAAKLKSAQEAMRAGHLATMNIAAEVGTSLMTVGRGVAALGLAGEKDLEKLVAGLVKVQGVFDVFSGAIQTWVKIQQMIEATRKTLLATAAAEEILAGAATKRGIAQGVAGSTGAGGLGAGLAGRLGLAGVGGSSAMVLGAGALALGGVAMGGMAIRDALSEDGPIVGGYSDTVGLGIYNTAALAGRGLRGIGLRDIMADDMNAYLDSFDATGRAESGRERAIQMAQLRDRRFGELVPRIEGGFSAGRARRAGQLSLDLEGSSSAEKQLRIAREIAELEEMSAMRRAEANAASDKSAQAEVALKKEALSLDKEINDLREQSARIAVEAAQAEVDQLSRNLTEVDRRIARGEQRIMQLQQGMRGGLQAFGLRDAAEQRQILDILARAQGGATLNRDEIRLLGSVRGSGQAQNLAALQAERLGRAAGGDALFGEERAQIDRLQRQVNRDQQVETDLRIDVKVSREGLAAQKAALKATMEDVLKETTEGILDELKPVVEGLSQLQVVVRGLSDANQNGGGGR